VEEGILHIELVNRPTARESQGEHCADGSRLHHWTECLIEVNTGPLGETSKNPSGLVPLKGAIRLEFVLEDPLAGDNIGPRRTGHKIPCVVL
jgi:hypothetical protein